MTGFGNCSPVFRAVTGSVITFFFFVSITYFILFVRQKHKKKNPVFINLFLTFLLFFMSQAFIEYNSIQAGEGDSIRDFGGLMGKLLNYFINMPYVIILLIGLITLVAELLCALEMHQWRKTHITPMSVKEAVDNLPEGVCIFTEDGRILLINQAMEGFGQSVTGSPLMNGEVFSAQVLEGELRPGCRRIRTGEKNIILLPDGRAFYAYKKEFPVEEEIYHILRVSDITKEYEKTMDLTHHQEQVRELNEKLVRYNQDIVDLAAEKEVLNAKVRIHDELGSGLLAIRKYLQDGGSEKEMEGILTGLHRNISFLQQIPEEKNMDEYELMIRTAEDLGVIIRIDGILPGGEKEKTVIAAAIHECITNTLRHAHGDELDIRIEEDERSVIAVFRNNGDQPEEPITEKGGLVSLRKLTEQSGGSMTVRSFPEFSLIIEIPKEDGGYGL